MLEQPGEPVFLVGLLLYYILIYGPHMRAFRRRRVSVARTRPADPAPDFVTFLDWQVLPLIAILSPWLEGLDDGYPARRLRWARCSLLACFSGWGARITISGAAGPQAGRPRTAFAGDRGNI